MIIRRATDEDNEQLCAIMADAEMGETINIAFERSPDYFAGAAVQAENVAVYVLVLDDVIQGLFSVGKRKVFLNGEIKSIRYLCDLRLRRGIRGGMYLARMYKYTKNELVEAGEIMQTLILEDNKQATKILTSKRSYLPHYHESCRYVTHILRGNNRKVKRSSRVAVSADIPKMQAFYEAQAVNYQFAPVMRFSEIETSAHFRDLSLADFRMLEENGEIVAMAAVWNQGEFKRTRIVSYVRWLKRLRVLINPFLSIPLPREGELLGTHYLFCFYVQNNDPEIAKTMIDNALQSLPQGEVLLAGIDEIDPINQVLMQYKGRREYGKHYVVCYNEAVAVEGITKFEVARI